MKATEENCDHLLHRYILLATLFVLLLVFVDHVAFAQSSMGLRVYGPGGPALAMKEAAKAFEQKTGTPVVVTAGPTSEWIEGVKTDADLIYSGSETMMTDIA